MLSLHRCRQILGSKAADSDDAIKQVREALYTLAHIAVDVYAKPPKNIPVRDFEAALGQVPPDARDDIEELAAIREYDGSFDRDVAERYALGDYLTGFSLKKATNGKSCRVSESLHEGAGNDTEPRRPA